MKRMWAGKYFYREYWVTKYGRTWEAVHKDEKVADYHANTKRAIKKMIDDDNNSATIQQMDRRNSTIKM